MAKQELVVSGSGLSNEVSGKIKKNTLKNGGAYIISLEKKLLDVSTLVQNMCDETGANPLEVMKILGDYQNCVLKHLGKGYSVKVLDLVTVQPTIRGSVDNKAEAEAKNEIKAKVTPLPLLDEAMKNLSVSKLEMFVAEAVIDSVKPHGYTGDTIIAGKSIDVTGDKIKIGSDEDGVYYAKTDGMGSIEDRANWVKLDASEIFHSTAKELTALVPSSLESGKYVLIVETSFLGGNKKRKEALFAASAPFNVVKA